MKRTNCCAHQHHRAYIDEQSFGIVKKRFVGSNGRNYLKRAFSYRNKYLMAMSIFLWVDDLFYLSLILIIRDALCAEWRACIRDKFIRK